MKTIRQLADEIGVSKAALQRRISREPLRTKLEHCLHLKGQTKFIDEKGESFIKTAYNAMNNDVNISIDSPMNTTDKLILMLEKELAFKNQQISDISTALLAEQKKSDGLQQALLMSQALHAERVKQIEIKEKRGIFGKFGKKKEDKND